MKSLLLAGCILGGLVSQTAGAAPILYGGLGGHAISSGPEASTNDGALVIVNQTNAAVTIVGHPQGVARITGLAFDSLGDLFASTLGNVPFPPPPPPSTSSLITVNPANGALLSSVPITAGGALIAIADLAIQPGTNVLYGVSTPVGGVPGQLYTINKSTGAATPLGAPQAFFDSIAFAPNGTLYESAGDLNEATGETVNPRLQVLNPLTGAVVGTPVTTSQFFGALGIRPTDSAIFGGTGDRGNIYIVDPTTGHETLVGNTGTNFVGDLAFTPVPEPATLGMSGLGLVVMAAIRRKSKIRS